MTAIDKDAGAQQPGSHMALWERVKTTPESATKEATVGGQKITSIDTIHMIQMATKEFGPMGIGWGYSIDEERFDQGAPVTDAQGTVIGHEQTHTIRMKLWYKLNGERGEVEQYGHTRAVYRTNKGTWMTDGEAPKKSTSDAMKKCLSLLGFSADIFSGLYDDQGYVAARRTEERLAKSDNLDAELDRLRQEFKGWLESQRKMLQHQLPHPRSIQLAGDKALNQLSDRASIARLDDATTGVARKQLQDAMQQGIERVTSAKQAERQAQTAQQPQESNHG
ncbi:hypothetical protein F0A16_02900 [Salinicola corii]|uniref:DNA repair protein n=1 Tax=Salinicola corii TaxID=2606937 RepID=A0A640WJD3_9GAMM|nr:hypothetical protein [Salinicola corii]KAA0020753.1 hypothetical protein F0A16_02900 [Salinicola corii]